VPGLWDAESYNQADVVGLQSSLSRTPFNQIASYDNIDDRWSRWKELFMTAVNEHIPTKYVNDINSPPWIDEEVRYLIRKNYSVLKRYRNDKIENKVLRRERENTYSKTILLIGLKELLWTGFLPDWTLVRRINFKTCMGVALHRFLRPVRYFPFLEIAVIVPNKTVKTIKQ
jgi:hypothetical protein